MTQYLLKSQILCRRRLQNQLATSIFPSPTVSWISSELLSRSPSDVIKDSAVLRSVSIAVWCPVIWPCRAWGSIQVRGGKEKKIIINIVYIYTLLYSVVWWPEDENNMMCKNVWIRSMEILSHYTDIVTCWPQLITLRKGLRFFAVICNQSCEYSVAWLAQRRLLSGHIYAVSHYLLTEKCLS